MKGSGSAGLWGDFTERLQAATGAGVFAYSRAGYGASHPAALRGWIDYMHIEALDVLPKILDAAVSAAACGSGFPWRIDRGDLCRRRAGSPHPRAGAARAAFHCRGISVKFRSGRIKVDL